MQSYLASSQAPQPKPRSLFLASGSPRRRALLRSAGICVEVVPSHADETWPTGLSLAAAVLVVTWRKLAHVPTQAPLALAADTVVALDNEILGKPENEAHARAMLARLSGRTHVVTTGFVLRAGAQEAQNAWEHAATVCTEVTFRQLSSADIARYVALGESLDKAGAYGIQSEGGSLVATVQGSYTNIVGLPLPQVLAAIALAPVALQSEPQRDG